MNAVFICNGCTDNTAGVASTFAPRITVTGLACGSTPNTLNIPEKTLDAGPRAYVDTEVLISGTPVGRLLDAVRDERAPADDRMCSSTHRTRPSASVRTTPSESPSAACPRVTSEVVSTVYLRTEGHGTRSWERDEAERTRP